MNAEPDRFFREKYSAKGKGRPPLSCRGESLHRFENRENFANANHEKGRAKDPVFGRSQSLQRMSRLCDTMKSSVFVDESENHPIQNTPQKKKIPQICRNPITGEVLASPRPRSTNLVANTREGFDRGNRLYSSRHLKGYSHGNLKQFTKEKQLSHDDPPAVIAGADQNTDESTTEPDQDGEGQTNKNLPI